MKQLLKLITIITLATQFASYATANPQKEPPATVYVVQLGAFSSPKAADFKAAQSIGYIYTEAAGKFQRVLLGKFEEKSNAQTALAGVKAAGFKDAFLATRKIDADAMTYGIQVASYKSNEPIEWDKWRVFQDLYAFVGEEGAVKILIGNANDIKTANNTLQTVRGKGIKQAFIKHINKGLIHPVTPFEMDVNRANIQITSRSASRNGAIVPKGGNILPVKPSETPVAYNNQGSASRVSVKKLQELLADNSNYTGDVSGVYDNKTEDAYLMFEDKNDRYSQYKLLAENRQEQGFKGGLQSYVDMVYDNPLMAYGGLKGETHPMADVYLAYMYHTGKANPKGADRMKLVNQLMNGAVQKVFVTGDYKGTTELDYNKTYDYTNVGLLIKHLSYMQDAMQDPPALPCWLFENHAQEAASMFNRLYSMASSCGDFMDWDELKILKTIAEDLDPVDHATLGKGDENIRMAYDSRRAQLYLAPTMSADEAAAIETWHVSFWKAMKAWEGNDPLHKKLITPLEVSYYKSLVQLENHYMGRDFNKNEAHALGLSVLRTVVNYHLNTYMK